MLFQNINTGKRVRVVKREYIRDIAGEIAVYVTEDGDRWSADLFNRYFVPIDNDDEEIVEVGNVLS